MTLPVPAPTTAEARHWFAAAAEERLELQRCGACGAARFYPRPVCTACGDGAYEWFVACGRGSVESFTIVHRAPFEAFRAQVPYVLALVALEEGPRMMANVVGADALGVAIGDALEVVFEDRGAGVKLPQFRRAGR